MIIIFLYLFSSFYFTFKPDEDVSMGLIQHNYIDLMNINSLDVHPPFYYLSLKFFVDITTFWTNSMFIDTIVARLFSFILLILFLIVMFKLIKKFNININYKWQIALFLIAPGVINDSAKIRMYSLGAFLLATELYQLVEFYQDNNNRSIILATIFATLAAYTLYPLAISAGLFLLLYFALQLIEHRKGVIKTFVAGLSLLILYLPWIPVLIKQMSMHSGKDGVLAVNYFYSAVTSITQLNAPSPYSPLLKYISLVSLIVIVLFGYIVKYSIYNFSRNYNTVFLISLINFGLTLILSIVFCKRQFRTTITYPIFTITIFFMISVVIFKYNQSKLLNSSKIFVFLSLVSLLMFMGYNSLATVNNVKHYDIPSIKLIKNFNNWKSSSNDNIDISELPSVKHQPMLDPTEVNQDSIYLKSINKNAIIPNDKMNISTASQGTFNNDNSYSLYNKVFNNLYFRK